MDSGTWLFPGEKDGPGFPVYVLFLAACIHSLGWDLCALGCDSGMLWMLSAMSGTEGNDSVHMAGGTQTSTLSTRVTGRVRNLMVLGQDDAKKKRQS